jgi:uroporphyrin-III C-methyltransferase/precorrin-2 dehydrogenase/sirohydrochlorin ferrochelatase
MPSSTPVIVMSDVSRTSERRWHGDLATLEVGIRQIGYDHPVLIAIGGALAAAVRRPAEAAPAAERRPRSAIQARA